MIRSSSKLITRAKGVRNMGKVPFKFRFDFLIETVEKIAASGDVVVIWERNHKCHSTAPAKIDRTTRKADFGNQKISASITLFKMSPTEKKFLDKVVKIAIKAGNAEGKTLGKIHLNLADYAEIPSGSKRIGAELSSGSSLIATIQCTFVSMGKTTRSSRNTGDLGMMSENEDDTASDIGEDGRDSLQDIPLSNSSASTTANAGKGSHKLPHLLSRTGSKKVRKEKYRGGEDDLGNGNLATGDIDKFKRENAVLRKQVEDLENNQYGNEDEFRALQEENRKLKKEVADLRGTLSREPVYQDVVKELKEAKLALALLQLEKDSMQLELHKHQKGENSPATVISSVRQ